MSNAKVGSLFLRYSVDSMLLKAVPSAILATARLRVRSRSLILLLLVHWQTRHICVCENKQLFNELPPLSPLCRLLKSLWENIRQRVTEDQIIRVNYVSRPLP